MWFSHLSSAGYRHSIDIFSVTISDTTLLKRNSVLFCYDFTENMSQFSETFLGSSSSTETHCNFRQFSFQSCFKSEAFLKPSWSRRGSELERTEKKRLMVWGFRLAEITERWMVKVGPLAETRWLSNSTESLWLLVKPPPRRKTWTMKLASFLSFSPSFVFLSFPCERTCASSSTVSSAADGGRW